MNTKFNARFPQVVAGNPDDAPSSADLDAVAAEQDAREATAPLTQDQRDALLAAEIGQMDKEPPSREALEKLAAEFREKFNARPGIKLLPNGSIALEVVIDEDLAGALLEWAEGAGEDAATWINRQINEALLSFCGK